MIQKYLELDTDKSSRVKRSFPSKCLVDIKTSHPYFKNRKIIRGAWGGES